MARVLALCRLWLLSSCVRCATAGEGDAAARPLRCGESDGLGGGDAGGSLLQCVGAAGDGSLEWPSEASETDGSFVLASGSEWLIRGVSPGVATARGAAFPSRISVESTAVLVLQRTRMQGLADWHGGALATHEGSDVTIAFSAFVDNRADHTGGAIWVGPRSSLRIERTVFERNSAQFGGAVHAGNDASVDVDSSTFLSNRAQMHGAALHATSGAVLTVTHTTFVRNSAEEGGAVDAEQSTLSVAFCNFSNNTATGPVPIGSAVRVRSPLSTLIVDTEFRPLAAHCVELDGTLADCSAHPPTTCGIGRFCTYEKFSLRCNDCPAPLFGNGVTCQACGNTEREAANGGACTCKTGYYGSVGECATCPARPGFVGACPGGDLAADGIAPLFPRPGFWMENAEMALSRAELVCPVDYCLGWSADLELEAKADETGVKHLYNSTLQLSCGDPPHFCAVLHTGRLCAECVDGAYKMPSGRCCELGSWSPAYATAFICILVGLLISVAARPEPLDVDSPGGTDRRFSPAVPIEELSLGPERLQVSSLSTDVAAALGTIGFFYQTVQLLNFPPKDSEWWYTPGSHLRDYIHNFVVITSDALSFDVKPERYPYHAVHPCEPLQCPPPFALGVLGSVYMITMLMPLLVTLGCCIGCAIQRSCSWQHHEEKSDDGEDPGRLISGLSSFRSSSRVSTTSSDVDHLEVVQQEAQEWAANRSLRSPETERLESLHTRSAASTLTSDSDGDESQGIQPATVSESGEDEDNGIIEAADKDVNEADGGCYCCCSCCRNFRTSCKLDPPGSVEKRHALYAILPTCCVVAPAAADRAKAHGWRCAGLIYQFCWLPIGRSALAVVLPRSSPWDPQSSPWDPNTRLSLLLQADPSVHFFITSEAKCAWVFGACVLLLLGIGIPDMIVCWGCWRAQPGHDTDDAVHPARTLHPALLPELYRPGWAAAVWFVLDVVRKFALVLCALAADGSSTPFDLPRWYVPGQTPVVTTLLLSLVTLAVCQPYRHLRHQCHEAVSLACLALVAQTADSTFAGWSTLGLTLVISLQIYRRHRSTTVNPLGLAFDACKQARWRRTDRYEQLHGHQNSTPDLQEQESMAATTHEEDGDIIHGEQGEPGGFAGLKAAV